MPDQIIVFMPATASTMNAGNGSNGRPGIIGGMIAVVLTLNMSIPTASTSTIGEGMISGVPASTYVPESAYGSITRRRKNDQGSSRVSTPVDHTSNNQVSSVPSASDHMSTLLTRVDSFAHLSDGWDGYEGDAPDQATVNNVVSFLGSLPSTFINNLTEYSLKPTSYGTINLEWALHDTDFVSVEIGHSQIAYFYEVKGVKGESSENIIFGSENYTSGVFSALKSLYTPQQA